MANWKLNRTQQFKNCPWKVEVSIECPHYDFSVDRHLLVGMPDRFFDEGTVSMIACRESTKDNPEYCVAWIQNQIGGPHNPRLRNNMYHCENAKDIKTFGKQHGKCTRGYFRRPKDKNEGNKENA